MADEPINPYTPPSVAQTERAVVEDVQSDGPKGIGGWLVVSLIGVIVVGLICLSGLVRTAAVLDEWLEWIVHFHRPDVALQLVGTVLVTSAVLGMAGLGIAWMFRHDRRLPKLMVAFYVLQAIMWVMGIIFYDPETGTSAYEAGRTMWMWFWPGRCVLWVAYYLSSERVKNTIVK
jgi:hypothetical protein